jgi:hypothetical protein
MSAGPGPEWLRAAYPALCLPFSFPGSGAKVRLTLSACLHSHVGTQEAVRPRARQWLDGVAAGWTTARSAGGDELWDALLFDRGAACTREDGAATLRSAQLRFECGGPGGELSAPAILSAGYPASRCALAVAVHLPQLCAHPRDELMRTTGALTPAPVAVGGGGGGGGGGALADPLALNATAADGAAASALLRAAAAPAGGDSTAARLVTALGLSPTGAAAFGAALPLLGGLLLLLAVLLVYRRLRRGGGETARAVQAYESALADEALHSLRKLGLSSRGSLGGAGAGGAASGRLGARGRVVRGAGGAPSAAAGAAADDDDEETAACVRAQTTRALARSLAFAAKQQPPLVAVAVASRGDGSDAAPRTGTAGGAPAAGTGAAAARGASARVLNNPLLGLLAGTAPPPLLPPHAAPQRLPPQRAGTIDVLNPAALAHSAGHVAAVRAAAAASAPQRVVNVRGGDTRAAAAAAAVAAASGGARGSTVPNSGSVAGGGDSGRLPPAAAGSGTPPPAALRPAVAPALVAAGLAVRGNPLAAFGNMPAGAGGTRRGTVGRRVAAAAAGPGASFRNPMRAATGGSGPG